MIIADKIISQRKKNGWSQEELAEKLGVSRQSVSKWESGLSVPDLNKIIAMSALFGVSTDYLLKDELEEATASETNDRDDDTGRVVSAEEANRFLRLTAQHSWRLALGVALCILSPILLILLSGAASAGLWGITEPVAAAVGLCVLLLLVGGAVALFIFSGMRLDEFEYLEKDEFSLAYGVAGIVEKKREEHHLRYCASLAGGVLLCIFSVLPLIVVGAMAMAEFYIVVCVALLLLLCAVGVFLIVSAACVHGSFEKLLQTGDYTAENKRRLRATDAISTAYWCVATAIYLGISFLTGAWHVTWVVWPVAGVLWPLIPALFGNRKA